MNTVFGQPAEKSPWCHFQTNATVVFATLLEETRARYFGIIGPQILRLGTTHYPQGG